MSRKCNRRINNSITQLFTRIKQEYTNNSSLATLWRNRCNRCRTLRSTFRLEHLEFLTLQQLAALVPKSRQPFGVVAFHFMSITKPIYTRRGYLIWKCWKRNSFLKIFISGLYDDSRNGNYTVPLRSNPFSPSTIFWMRCRKEKCWRMLNKREDGRHRNWRERKGVSLQFPSNLNESIFIRKCYTNCQLSLIVWARRSNSPASLLYFANKKNVHYSLLFVLHISDSINPWGPIWVLGLISVHRKIEGLEQHRCIQNLVGVHGKGWQ